MPTRRDVEPGDFGHAGAHRLAMRADLRRFANERRVEIDNQTAARSDAACGMGKEDFRRRILPLRIGGREMGPDVALGERAVEGVGERVQRDVGV